MYIVVLLRWVETTTLHNTVICSSVCSNFLQDAFLRTDAFITRLKFELSGDKKKAEPEKADDREFNAAGFSKRVTGKAFLFTGFQTLLRYGPSMGP